MSNALISDEKKIEILNSLLKSTEFQSSKYGKLIEYLIYADIKGEELKEATIAIDCFQKDSTFNPAIDSSVRVYLSNLRKKIEHYYLTDGKEDEFKINIPKGSYQIEFINNVNEPRKIKFGFYKPAFFVSFILLVAFIVLFFWSNNPLSKQPAGIIDSNDFIWNDFINSKKKTLIVLGDYYFFSMPYAEGRQSYIRDIEINSKSDMQSFLEKNPSFADKISPTYHTWLEESHPWCIARILPSFVLAETNFEIKLSSEIQLQDLQNYNIVYIGPYKSLNILANITNNLNFKYTLHQGASSIDFHEISTNNNYSYSWKTNSQTNARNDYATVLKVAGPSANKFIFFISEHDFGNVSTVKYFTDSIKLKDFADKLSTDHFEALFEVTGIVRTDFTIKLLRMNELKSDFKINFEE
ncbi:MAG: hypothetical protein KJ571_03650 [Bacteroidetes bacterium]|nr:hypothetical protein [Bacteroidota bacterium]